MKENKIIASHLHIPLQSGCNRILKLMNRKYDLDYYKKRIKEIRKYRDDLSITTDLIVGFPGETESDFEETLNTLNEIKFTKIHTFPYSRREGTPASKMPNQIRGDIKKERVNKVLKLSASYEEKFYKKYINKTEQGVAEVRKDGTVVVHSSNFIPIIVNSSNVANNDILEVNITKVDGVKVYGEIKD